MTGAAFGHSLGPPEAGPVRGSPVAAVQREASMSASGRSRGQEVLRVVGVRKSFGQVQALDGVDMSVDSGEVVALVGDNGAGKSTLVKVISGVVPLDKGELYMHGARVVVHSPNDAVKLGIFTIHQDLGLADNLGTVENLFLGRALYRAIGPLRWVDFRAMRERTRAVLSELGIGNISDINLPVSQLSGGQRQTVAVARTTLNNCSVLLLDEPTASLGLREARHVMELVIRLRQQGVGLLLISHNIRQVFEVADRIVVLRLGRVATVFHRTETTPDGVVKAIMGRQ